MNRWDMTSLTAIRGKDVIASDGDKIGSVRDIYYDDSSGEPEWIGVGTGFLGMKERVVPVECLSIQGERVLVGLPKAKIQDEPDFDVKDDHLPDADEVRLSSYFGLAGRHQHSTRMLRFGEDYNGPHL